MDQAGSTCCNAWLAKRGGGRLRGGIMHCGSWERSQSGKEARPVRWCGNGQRCGYVRRRASALSQALESSSSTHRDSWMSCAAMHDTLQFSAHATQHSPECQVVPHPGDGAHHGVQHVVRRISNVARAVPRVVVVQACDTAAVALRDGGAPHACTGRECAACRCELAGAGLAGAPCASPAVGAGLQGTRHVACCNNAAVRPCPRPIRAIVSQIGLWSWHLGYRSC